MAKNGKFRVKEFTKPFVTLMDLFTVDLCTVSDAILTGILVEGQTCTVSVWDFGGIQKGQISNNFQYF